jgi:hypothetical protein
MTDREYQQALKRALQGTPDTRHGVWVAPELATEMRRRGHLPMGTSVVQGSSTPPRASDDYIMLVDEPGDYIEIEDEPSVIRRRELEAFWRALNHP